MLAKGLRNSSWSEGEVEESARESREGTCLFHQFQLPFNPSFLPRRHEARPTYISAIDGEAFLPARRGPSCSVLCRSMGESGRGGREEAGGGGGVENEEGTTTCDELQRGSEFMQEAEKGRAITADGGKRGCRRKGSGRRRRRGRREGGCGRRGDLKDRGDQFNLQVSSQPQQKEKPSKIESLPRSRWLSRPRLPRR